MPAPTTKEWDGFNTENKIMSIDQVPDQKSPFESEIVIQATVQKVFITLKPYSKLLSNDIGCIIIFFMNPVSSCSSTFFQQDVNGHKRAESVASPDLWPSASISDQLKFKVKEQRYSITVSFIARFSQKITSFIL